MCAASRRTVAGSTTNVTMVHAEVSQVSNMVRLGSCKLAGGGRLGAADVDASDVIFRDPPSQSSLRRGHDDRQTDGETTQPQRFGALLHSEYMSDTVTVGELRLPF